MAKPPPDRPKDPFAALEAMRATLPPGPAPAPAPAAAPAPARTGPRPPPRAIVRMERKGRGGKEVTVVELLAPGGPRGVPPKPAELEHWCRELKQKLGCGGAVDGGLIMLQGDLRTRIGALLEGFGIGRVTIG